MTPSEGRASPFAPHTAAETAAMLDAVGVESAEALFDIPESVRFDGSFDIEARSERAVRREVTATLDRNDELVEFLGRGHYDQYVPAVVDDLSARSEFLTSYTQYQPEIAQGFLQALFEYQSMLVELTGLGVANCSMYDAATALGEAGRMADRVDTVSGDRVDTGSGDRVDTISGDRVDTISGDRVLVPALLEERRRTTLENYVEGAGLAVESYPMDDANVAVDALRARAAEDVVMVYAENPTVRGTVEENLATVGEVASDHGALFCLGSDPVALALLEEPASVGADVVVGPAVLGLPAAYGMDLGVFACRETFLRQTPGRLVGATEDAAGRRAYTLTLQTREQHIRRERATSNICTNQAWIALRVAMHAALLGPDGLQDLARDSVLRVRDLAGRLDDVAGVTAPVHDRHHVREFVARTERPAPAVAGDLRASGFAVHVVGDHLLQICVTGTTEAEVQEFVATVREAAR